MRFIIADDSRPTRLFVKGCIVNDLGLEVVGEAENGEEAVALCRELRPDFVILDVNMEPMGGVAAAAIIQAEALAQHIIMFTHAKQALPALRALGYDAHGKPLKREVLAAHIREVIRGSHQRRSPGDRPAGH